MVRAGDLAAVKEVIHQYCTNSSKSLLEMYSTMALFNLKVVVAHPKSPLYIRDWINFHNPAGKNKLTLMHTACKVGSFEIVILLMALGGSVKEIDNTKVNSACVVGYVSKG